MEFELKTPGYSSLEQIYDLCIKYHQNMTQNNSMRLAIVLQQAVKYPEVQIVLFQATNFG